MALNLKELAALQAVMTEGTVTGAAKRLHRTQPVVSRLIAQLESNLGFRLFRREKQRLIPTAAGLAFYEEANRAFALLDEIESSARNIQKRRASPLKILAQSHIAHGLLNVALGQFCSSRPDFRFSLEIRQREYISHWIANREFDIGFAPDAIDHPQVQATRLFRAPLYIALPSSHPLAQKRRLSITDIGSESFIALRPGIPLRSRLDALFGVKAKKLQIRGETPTALSACQLVEQGLGITLADPFSIITLMRRSKLAIRMLQPAVEVQYVALRRSGDEPSPVADALVTVVRKTSEQLLKQVARHAGAW